MLCSALYYEIPRAKELKRAAHFNPTMPDVARTQTVPTLPTENPTLTSATLMEGN